jgi:hypothetical protein
LIPAWGLMETAEDRINPCKGTQVGWNETLQSQACIDFRQI